MTNLEKQILETGRFSGTEELWDVIHALAEAIHTLNEKVSSLGDAREDKGVKA